MLTFPPLPSQVVCGRGCGHFSSSKGNLAFRKLVEDNLDRYEDAPKQNKMDISQEIVAIIRKRGGKFLQFDVETSKWSDMGDRRAIEKTSQTFRDMRTKPNGAIKVSTTKNSPTLSSPAISASSKTKTSSSTSKSTSKPSMTPKSSSTKASKTSKTSKVSSSSATSKSAAKSATKASATKKKKKKKPTSISNPGGSTNTTKKTAKTATTSSTADNVKPTKPKKKKSKKNFLTSPGGETGGWLSDLRLRVFVSQHENCLKCTPIYFVNWLESEEIYNLEQFVDTITNDPDFAVIQVKVNGVKWYKYNQFTNAAKTAVGRGNTSSSGSYSSSYSSREDHSYSSNYSSPLSSSIMGGSNFSSSSSYQYYNGGRY